MQGDGGVVALVRALRGPRVAGMAVFDWAASLAAAALVGTLLSVRGAVRWAAFLVAWVALGVAVHAVAGVSTPLGFYLGLNGRPASLTR
jgi:hypothetical protein